MLVGSLAYNRVVPQRREMRCVPDLACRPIYLENAPSEDMRKWVTVGGVRYFFTVPSRSRTMYLPSRRWGA